ncbi:MAG: hypothetical protein J6L23_04640, partial [Clostridia bacterium]|nr:hypothetical protein [Clostridia bacterium]
MISTREKLEKAKVENIEKIKLSNILFSTGYSVETKKGESVVYSVSFGSSKYLLPQEILKAYNKTEVNLISNLSFNKELISQTGYSAYCEFIAG